jgi:hypothetical protein
MIGRGRGQAYLWLLAERLRGEMVAAGRDRSGGQQFATSWIVTQDLVVTLSAFTLENRSGAARR